MPRLGSKVLKARSKPNMTQRDGYEFTDANRAQQQGALWRGAARFGAKRAEVHAAMRDALAAEGWLAD
jgi:hypothetical protein